MRQHVVSLVAALTSMNAFSAHAQLQPSAANTSLRSAVVVLGDGTPVLSADRSGTSIGVVVRGTIYVFDAGPGVLRRLFEAQQRLGLGIVTLGPVFVTSDEIRDPYTLTIRCEIKRTGQILFSGETTLGMMKRKIEELIDFLFLANTIPTGTVLLTGTGIIQTEEAALRESDVVEITIPEIGKLVNVAQRV